MHSVGIIASFLGCVVSPQDVRETFVSSDQKFLLLIDGGAQPLPSPAIDPKHKWMFPFEIAGSITENRQPSLERVEPRFRVYCQSQKDLGLAKSVTRTLLRTWDLVHSRLGFDHSRLYGKLVHVYLCEGGTPGGEQGIFQRQNAIYIYQLSTFSSPLEMAREVAHEYGHAILPAVGGFVSPEDWGNGYLGERLFLTWAKEVPSGDFMGVSKVSLNEWLKTKAEPLAKKVWQNGTPENMKMDDYIGLNLYAWQAFPTALGRAMLLSGGQQASDCVRGLVEAVNEKKSWRITPPRGMTEVWLPLKGKWSISGGTFANRRGDWVRVKVQQSVIAVSKN